MCFFLNCVRERKGEVSWYVMMMTSMMPRIRKDDAKPYGVSACVET
jgi:hypothetical protein